MQKVEVLLVWKIAVCDDEKVIAEQISSMIEKELPESKVYQFFSGEELLAQNKEFDIYFLDIQMEKITGIEAAKRLRKQDENCVIVFITGVKEYVFEAFDVAALHYLIKPVQEEKLKEVLKRAIKEIEKNRHSQGNGTVNRQIFIRTRNKSITVNVSDILYFENEMRKIIVHTKQDAVTFYGNMADMEKQAGAGFYRCHRGYLVNMVYIAEYNAENIYLCNGNKVYLAKEKYQDFVQQYMRYLRNGGVSHV